MSAKNKSKTKEIKCFLRKLRQISWKKKLKKVTGYKMTFD